MENESRNLASINLNSDLTEYAMTFVNRSQDKSAVESQLNRVYVFSSAEQNFVLPRTTRAELITHPSYTPLPNAPEFCLGLVSVRGLIAPLYSLDIYFSADQASKKIPYGLLIGEASEAIMIAVNEKTRSFQLDNLGEPNATAHTELSLQMQEVVEKVYVGGGEKYCVLNPRRLAQSLAKGDLVSPSVDY